VKNKAKSISFNYNNSFSLSTYILKNLFCVCVRACLEQMFDISCVLLPINAASNFKSEF